MIDTSFAAAARGKIGVYQQKGQPIPDDWVFDVEGRPATDPDRVALLRPIGGYKGVGLAMGLFSTVLSGSAYGSALEAGAAPGWDGQFVLAPQISAFTEMAAAVRRVDAVISEFRASRVVEDGGRIYCAFRRNGPVVPRVLSHPDVGAAKRRREGWCGTPSSTSFSSC